MTTKTLDHDTAKKKAIPRKVLISAWSIPVLVLTEFTFLAIIPVVIILVAVLRRGFTGALRWSTIVLGAVYATPMAIWALRPNPASSLSKDMSPVFLVLIPLAALGVVASAYLHRKKEASAVSPESRSTTRR